jgi:zinc finger protein
MQQRDRFKYCNIEFSEDLMDEKEGDEGSVIQGKPVEIRLDNPCIACGKKSVVNVIANLDLPMLGKAVQTTYMCEACGYRHSDVIMLENRGALRFEAFIEREEDLSIRVIRSNSGTLRIPELGVDIEPGIASESFISNAEGVLERVADVIRILRIDAEADICEKCDALLETIQRMKDGISPFHIIIDDPYGNSALVGRTVTITKLSEEEAEELKTGEMTFSTGTFTSWRDEHL